MGKIQRWAPEKARVFVVMCEMDYFSCLNTIGQQRYMDKLRLLETYPWRTTPTMLHANSINFVKDMSHWPPIEYGHIFCFFVDRPGVYTRQQMLQWKQLDAYNYFTSGFVRTVEMWDLRNTGECTCDTEGSREHKHEKSRKCSQRLGSDQEIWRYSGSTLYLHGWVSLHVY